MIDLELELGIAWRDKAKTDYELYAAIVEKHSNTTLPNWEELPTESQLAWELPARDTEARLNGTTHPRDIWYKFAERRLNK